jgi:hypothetical protein
MMILHKFKLIFLHFQFFRRLSSLRMRKSAGVSSPVQSGREVENSPHKVQYICTKVHSVPLDGISVANSFQHFPPKMAKNAAE